MSYTTWKIEYVPYVDSTWDNNDLETLTRFKDVNLRVNLGDKKDSIVFNSTNFYDANNGKFNPNDKLYIYRAVNSDIVSSSDMIMTATIKDSPDQVSFNKDMTKVEGYNYSEAVASAIVFVDAKGKTIPEALQLALNKAGNNSSFKVDWDSSNPSTQLDGSAFPTVQEKWFNWTLKRILEQYSSSRYTEDGAYIWYVTKDNKLRWFSRNDATQITEFTFNYTTDNLLAIKSAKDIKEVKNHIIIKGGRGPDNKAIQESIIDYASVAKHGRKYLFYVSSNNNADNLVKEDTGSNTDKYPDTFPFTTTWTFYTPSDTGSETIEGVTCTNGSTVTIPSTTEAQQKTRYNAIVRKHVKNLIKREGKEIIDLLKYGKLKIDLSFQAGQKSWALGDLVDCTVPQAFSGSKILRVDEIQYTQRQDIYSLVEDEGTL